MTTSDDTIVSLDIETTGLDVAESRIVEIALVKRFPDGKKELFHSRINPGVPIPQETTDIHGITDDMVIGCPFFADLANTISEFMQGCVIVGYGVAKFDVPILESEMSRAGLEFDSTDFVVVDGFSVFKIMEQRTLGYALKHYCGREIEGAHSADVDAHAAMDVVLAQMDRYGDLFKDGLGAVDVTIDPERKRRVDPDGKLLRDPDGRIRMGFGKHEGRLLSRMAAEPGGHAYLEWMLSADFSTKVKAVIERHIKKS